MNKNLVVNVVALVLVMLGALGAGYGQSESSACNNKLIVGNYGFTIQGNKLGGLGPVGPQVGVAMTEFDGKGGLTQIDTVTVSGEVVADFTHTPATGTYTVNSDCTGTFTINFTDGRPPVVISAGGSQGIIATGSIGKKRFSKHLTPRLANRGQRDRPIKERRIENSVPISRGPRSNQ